MRRLRLVRAIACAFALFGSLSAPVQALAHGQVHAHLAEHHIAATLDDHHVVALGLDAAPVGHGHKHSHPSVNAVPGQRDLARVVVAHESVVALPASLNELERHEVVAPARTDLALLARPGPEGGPPPQLRAPPLS